MITIPQIQYQKLIDNGDYSKQDEDQIPVVKFYLPHSALVWLFTKMNHSNPHMVYGLQDYGVGQPEEGWFDVRELDIIENFYGDIVQQDVGFQSEFPLSVYRLAADSIGQIVESESILSKFTSKTNLGPKPQ